MERPFLMHAVGVLARCWSRITVDSVGILESFSSVDFFPSNEPKNRLQGFVRATLSVFSVAYGLRDNINVLSLCSDLGSACV